MLRLLYVLGTFFKYFQTLLKALFLYISLCSIITIKYHSFIKLNCIIYSLYISILPNFQNYNTNYHPVKIINLQLHIYICKYMYVICEQKYNVLQNKHNNLFFKFSIVFLWGGNSFVST